MDELTDFQKTYFDGLRKEELAQLHTHKETINAFKSFCKGKGIHLEDENFKYFYTSGIIATYPNLTTYLSESLTVDKEGLLDFDRLAKEFPRKRFMNGFLYAENYMLMAHYYFRRSYHQANNFAPSFVDLFWALPKPGIQCYLSIDPDSVRINMNGYTIMERDMWFGAQFKNTIEDIPDGIVKLRPPLDIESSHIDFFFASAYSLDIKWASKDGVKSVQMEEFKSEEVTLMKEEMEYHPVRYIHAEFDVKEKRFRHFDGAIHFYTKEEYFQRRDDDFNYNAKNTTHIKTLSQKLFKVNGAIEVAEFVELTSHFFAKNPLIIEYFQGEYPNYILELLAKLRTRE
ncbi:hypothetical protein [Pedobacter sp. UC225_65]|uniref:hypothetical protein n=1 Tax=Pedobacter sp. UC225_65 TaxID=3350173 RepID=UPI00366AF81A